MYKPNRASKAFFEPAALTYITNVIPEKGRKQFNSFRSLITSSAFLIGPAISGALLLFTSVNMSIWINAFSFIVSAIMVYLLPNLNTEVDVGVRKISLEILKSDWKEVFKFSQSNLFIVKV
ncbi:MFS transporter [Rossellomorea aquimaris]|uniref:MFS transporter n=1 Tax=Rossellomorea aquimaris TaxID=189382 RepID=UPI003CF4C273